MYTSEREGEGEEPGEVRKWNDDGDEKSHNNDRWDDDMVHPTRRMRIY